MAGDGEYFSRVVLCVEYAAQLFTILSFSSVNNEKFIAFFLSLHGFYTTRLVENSIYSADIGIKRNNVRSKK